MIQQKGANQFLILFGHLINIDCYAGFSVNSYAHVSKKVAFFCCRRPKPMLENELGRDVQTFVRSNYGATF